MDMVKLFLSTYRRNLLDLYLNQNKKLFHGMVLDIGGGRERGEFKPPKVKKWIKADINKNLNSDVICDVHNLCFKDNSIDVIKATELFEHVRYPEKGLKECYRVLKGGGHMIISIPFMFPIHADPHDYYRYTEMKWRDLLNQTGFKIEKLIIMGRFFTVFADMIKTLMKSMPKGIRHLSYILIPFLNLIIKLDNWKFVKKHKYLNKYTTGYFIILKKGEKNE